MHGDRGLVPRQESVSNSSMGHRTPPGCEYFYLGRSRENVGETKFVKVLLSSIQNLENGRALGEGMYTFGVYVVIYPPHAAFVFWILNTRQ